MSEVNPFEDAQSAHELAKTRCTLCPAVAKLSQTRRHQLYDALMGRRIKYSIIRDVLESWGIVIGITAISNHVNGHRLNQRCVDAVASKWELPDE